LIRAKICETLHIDTEALFDKYLGLPALVGADRSDCFLHFVERIIQRINGWKEILLSIGGDLLYVDSNPHYLIFMSSCASTSSP
jgi:hypothetical protein